MQNLLNSNLAKRQSDTMRHERVSYYFLLQGVTLCSSAARSFVLISFILINIALINLMISFQASAQSASFTEMTRADMQNQLHSDEFTLIELGEGKVPIQISLSQQAITKGVVLIISDADMPLGRKDSLVNIAQSLPTNGWTTVVMPSLGLDFGANISFANSDIDPAAIETAGIATGEPADTTVEKEQSDPLAEGTEPKVDVNAAKELPTDDEEKKAMAIAPESRNSRSSIPSVSEAELVVYASEVEAYLDAVLKHMKVTMGHRIIVSQGITAATIAKLISDENPTTQEIDALVINNPYWPIRKLNNQVPMVIAQTSIPVLDLTSHWDNSWSKQTENKRRIEARTALKEVYRQTEVIGQSFDHTQMDYISREIKGWTTYLGW
jgi:hypothetical protein